MAYQSSVSDVNKKNNLRSSPGSTDAATEVDSVADLNLSDRLIDFSANPEEYLLSSDDTDISLEISLGIALEASRGIEGDILDIDAQPVQATDKLMSAVLYSNATDEKIYFDSNILNVYHLNEVYKGHHIILKPNLSSDLAIKQKEFVWYINNTDGDVHLGKISLATGHFDNTYFLEDIFAYTGKLSDNAHIDKYDITDLLH